MKNTTFKFAGAMQRIFRCGSVPIVFCLGLAMITPVSANTIANWRHEEGTDGGLIPAGDNTVLDSSETIIT